MHKTRTGFFALLVLSTTLAFMGCEKSSSPTAPVTSSIDPADLHTRFDSDSQMTAVLSVPQARSYPGTKVAGEVSVCKDASSPAGSYTFNVSAANTHPGDLVATTVTVSPGQRSLNRFPETHRTGSIVLSAMKTSQVHEHTPELRSQFARIRITARTPIFSMSPIMSRRRRRSSHWAVPGLPESWPARRSLA